MIGTQTFKASAKQNYWNHCGRFQAMGDYLRDLVPPSGSVPLARTKNKALDLFRRASNCYYDLFNNGLCNRKAEFIRIFKWGHHLRYAHINYRDDHLWEVVDARMDEIILAAAKEQNIVVQDYSI